MFPYEDSKTVSVCLSVRSSVPREKKSPNLRQYQSYISNWYINRKVFTSTTAWKPQNFNFFSKKVKIKIKFLLVFWLGHKSWNHLSFVNISPTVVFFFFFFFEGLNFSRKLWIWKTSKLKKTSNKKSYGRGNSLRNKVRGWVIDTSMERSSRVLQHGIPKIWFSLQKRSKLNSDLCWRAEITLTSSISVL